MDTTQTETIAETDQLWLIYDGECGFCRACVDWLLARDRRGRLRAVPYQEAPDPPLTPELRTRAARSVLVIGPGGRARGAGRAVLAALREIGWMPPLVAIASRRPLIWLVEIGYRIVATNRRHISRVVLRRRCAGCGRERG